MSVPSLTPISHTTPASDTPNPGAIPPSGGSPATPAPLPTRVIRRGRSWSWPGPKLRQEPTGPRGFAFGTNDAAATWAYGVATDLDLRPSHIRVYKVYASFGEAEKDAQGTRIGDYGTWANIHPTIKTVMRAANVSRSVVDRAVRELKDLHLMAEDGEAASGAKIYRLAGTPEHPLPEAVERQRALSRGEIWFGEPLPPAADTASGPVDKPVDNPGSLIFENRSDVPSELGTDAQPKNLTDLSPPTPGTEPAVFEDNRAIARPDAEGVCSVPNRAKSERQAALTKKSQTAPKDRPTNPRGTRKAPERHAEPRTLVEWTLMELTERMTRWQRDDTLTMARAVLADEAITEAQLVHRLRANLRMIGGGNRSTSPYGFARKTLFKKPFGCDDPYCEDGDVFTADPTQPPTKCPRCAERRMDRAAKRRQDQAQSSWWDHGPEQAAPPARGPRHPSDREQPWCGACDQRTRRIEVGFWERDPAPCPNCAPIPAGTIPRQGTPVGT